MSGSSTSSFLTTQWTQVLAARGDSTSAGAALGKLCAAYYSPVNAFLRRSGRGEDDARDLTHGFFEWVLSRDPFAAADRQRGRFRSYLLGALKHYLIHEQEKQHAQKRRAQGGHVHLQPATDTSPGIDPADRHLLPPDREFDRQWALHILRTALGNLEEECVKAGGAEAERFPVLKPFLSGEASHGGLASLAATHGWPESTARSHLHRLRHRFRHHVKSAITPTLGSGGETEDELVTLMAALTGE